MRETLNQLLQIPAINHRLPGELSGFDVAYGADEKAAVTAGQLTAGVRVPDMELVGKDGVLMSLYSLLVEGRWLHLSFKPGASVSGPEWLRSTSVQSLVADPSDHAALRGVRALLVRPDGYVAAVDQE